jgi:hypothetical protein
MTSIAGNRVVLTPCCRAFCLEVAYRSINYSAQEFWTDGEATNSLAPTDCGLRRCACGSHYVLAELEWGDRIDGDKYMGRELAHAHRVSDDALEHILFAGTSLSRPTEIATRRRLWRLLNHEYRARYRKAKEREKAAIPPYAPSTQQIENMEHLLALLDDDVSLNALECAELLRELGRFSEADAMLVNANDEERVEAVGKLLEQLIKDRIVAPIRYRL